MLLLLLLLLFKNSDTPYYEFFFRKLLTEAEKKKFLENFKDEAVVTTLKDFIELFSKHPFFDAEIDRLAAEKGFYNFDLIRQWQRAFYLSVYNEYKLTREKKEYFNGLSSNSSFQYLLSLDKEKELEHLFLLLNARRTKEDSTDVNEEEFLKREFAYIVSASQIKNEGDLEK